MFKIEIDVDPLLFLFALLDGSGKLMSLILLSGLYKGVEEALRGSHPVRRQLVPILLFALIASLFWMFLAAALILGITQRIRKKYPSGRA